MLREVQQLSGIIQAGDPLTPIFSYFSLWGAISSLSLWALSSRPLAVGGEGVVSRARSLRNEETLAMVSSQTTSFSSSTLVHQLVPTESALEELKVFLCWFCVPSPTFLDYPCCVYLDANFLQIVCFASMRIRSATSKPLLA